MTKAFNWRIWGILLAGATLGIIAILPYSLALGGGLPPQANLPMPLPLLIALQLGSQMVLFGVAAAIGLSFANSIGLGLPILEKGLRGESVWAQIRSFLPVSVILGVGSAVLIIALDIFVFQPAIRSQLAAAGLTGPAAKPAAWKGFLASFYGGIDEEILLRLCVMSFLAWVGRFLSKTADGNPTTAVFWTANVLAAVLFGLGHLPATSAIYPLTALVVLRAIALNGLAGVAFGYLFVKNGLESAMISHFSADIVLHVLFAI
jgi:hypothetical protein